MAHTLQFDIQGNIYNAGQEYTIKKAIDGEAQHISAITEFEVGTVVHLESADPEKHIVTVYDIEYPEERYVFDINEFVDSI